MSFARPLVLLALAALPLWWWLRARRLARMSGTTMSDVRPATGVAERVWLARLPLVLRSACLAAWIVAAAGPRIGPARLSVQSEGISIVLCVDVSSSMLSEDFAPSNRIDVAKETAIDFVRARTSDRIGVVAFAAQALTQVPLTTDYAVLEEALDNLRVGMLEDGTAIGTAIATAANRLRRAPEKTKVIILLTDGVNNRGRIDPRTAAEAAAAYGIRIYTIGVGTQGEAPVPTGEGPEGLRLRVPPRRDRRASAHCDIATMTAGRVPSAPPTPRSPRRAHLRRDQSPRENDPAARRLPPPGRGVPRAVEPRPARARAGGRGVGDVRGARPVITFDAPVVLALAPAVAGLTWFAVAWARRVRLRRAALWSAETEALSRRAGRGGPTAIALATFFGTVALAGPRWGEETVVAETRGLDVVVAIDISKSMLAEDAQPSRLGRALREARRLVQDLDGDRIGLVAFAGTSYILSPLSIDGSAVSLYLAAIDPGIASQGGTALAPPLAQGGELLRASPDLADRILVVFTDGGSAQDSLPDIVTRGAAAERRRRAHLISTWLRGGRTGALGSRCCGTRQGALRGYQRDTTRQHGDRNGPPRRHSRRDGGRGPGHAGRRGRARPGGCRARPRRVLSPTRPRERGPTRSVAARGLGSALLCAVTMLLGQAASRRTAALMVLALLIGSPACGQDVSRPPKPRRSGVGPWQHGASGAQRRTWRRRARIPRTTPRGPGAGTAALAAGDRDTARAALLRASASLDPEIRFRALYNLGLEALLAADRDTLRRDAHLEEARPRVSRSVTPSSSRASGQMEPGTRCAPPRAGERGRVDRPVRGTRWWGRGWRATRGRWTRRRTELGGIRLERPRGARACPRRRPIRFSPRSDKRSSAPAATAADAIVGPRSRGIKDW